MINSFTNLLICSILVESLSEIVIDISSHDKYVKKYGPIIIGVFIAFATSTGFLQIIGLDTNSIVDYVLTGIILSRGSNFTHDILKSIEGFKNNQFTNVKLENNNKDFTNKDENVRNNIELTKGIIDEEIKVKKENNKISTIIESNESINDDENSLEIQRKEVDNDENWH